MDTRLKPLDYNDLYALGEELQKLRGAQLQSVHQVARTRYALALRLPGQSRWVIIDLTPARPFIVSTSSTTFKKTPQTKTPLFNFLNAHFLNLQLINVEVAQKPNRIVKFEFGGGTLEEKRTLIFKCFPHGQHLILFAGEKSVNGPWRPAAEWQKDLTQIAFVEPEVSPSWDLNERLARYVLPSLSSAPTGPEAYKTKLIAKLEKAVMAIDQGMDSSKSGDLDKIAALQKEAQEMKGAPDFEPKRLDDIYSEVKRTKRKALVAATRRNELLAQIEKLRSDEELAPAIADRKAIEDRGKTRRNKSEEPFSGTRIVIDRQWQLWVGRNAWQNDDLVRIANPHDLWIHLRDYPGAHGVLRGPKKAVPPQKHIEFACRVVAILSQSKKNPFSEGDKLDFIVTPKKFVKKPKGEAPGRVIVEREEVRRIAFKNVKF